MQDSFDDEELLFRTSGNMALSALSLLNLDGDDLFAAAATSGGAASAAGLVVSLIAPTSPARLVSEQPLALLDVEKDYELRFVGASPEFQTLIRLGFVDTAAGADERIQKWLESHQSTPMLDVADRAMPGVASHHVLLKHAALLVSWAGPQASLFFRIKATAQDFSKSKNGALALQVDTMLPAGPVLQTCGVQVAPFKNGVKRKLTSDGQKVKRARASGASGQYRPAEASVLLSDVPPHYCLGHNPALWGDPFDVDFDSLMQDMAGLMASSPRSSLHPQPPFAAASPFPTTASMAVSPAAHFGLPPPRLLPSSPAGDVRAWLVANKFSACVVQLLEGYTGEILLAVDKADLVAICGLPDGIRLDIMLKSHRVTMNSSFTQTDESLMDVSVDDHACS